MDTLQKTDPEAIQPRLKAQGDDLRHRYSTGHYGDNLPLIVPGIANTHSMVEASFLDHLESIGQLQADERPRLRELRLESLRDQTRLLGQRLAEVTELSDRLADALGESLSHSLATSGRLKTLTDRVEEGRKESTGDWIYLHAVVENLVGAERYQEACEAITKELNDEKNL